MIKAEIRASDLAELKRDLKALQLKNLLRGELDPLGASIIQKAGAYPPPTANSRRTGRLGRSWQSKVWDMKLEVENYASYAGYVHGEEQTATHRATGWKRLFEVASTQTDKLMKKLSDKIDRIWRT